MQTYDAQGQLRVVQGSTAASTVTGILRGYINGFTLSNSGVDVLNDIYIDTGSCADSTGVTMMYGTPMTKQLDVNWTAGNNQGGLDTGAEAVSTWYHIWAILKNSDATVDYLFSLNATTPTMPTGYTYKRRLGSIFNTSSSTIRLFTQTGNEFQWITPITDLNASNAGAYGDLTLSVPTGISVRAFGTGVTAPGHAAAVRFKGSSAGTTVTDCFMSGSGVSCSAAGMWAETTDTLARIQWYGTAGGSTQMITRGWIDNRDGGAAGGMTPFYGVDEQIILQDEKAAGTPGGTFTQAGWRTRDLNIKAVDTGANCTLASNQFTLTPGTYEVYGRAPAVGVESHRIRLQNITDVTTVALGETVYTYSTSVDSCHAHLWTRVTITNTKTFELQHWCTTTRATNGLGVNMTGGPTGVEIYATVRLRKVATTVSPADGTIHTIVLRDEKATGTAGGTFTSGAWRTRDLTAEVVDTGNFCSLAANQFTLAAGTYEIEAIAPALGVLYHQAKLFNVSDVTDVIFGTAMYADNVYNGMNFSHVVGRFTINTSKSFEIRHYCTNTIGTTGFGVNLTFSSLNVYTTIFLRKVA